MTSQWENRERRMKRIALAISILLHVAALAVITTSFGEGAIHDLIEDVFGSGEKEQNAEAKV